MKKVGNKQSGAHVEMELPKEVRKLLYDSESGSSDTPLSVNYLGYIAAALEKTPHKTPQHNKLRGQLDQCINLALQSTAADCWRAIEHLSAHGDLLSRLKGSRQRLQTLKLVFEKALTVLGYQSRARLLQFVIKGSLPNKLEMIRFCIDETKRKFNETRIPRWELVEITSDWETNLFNFLTIDDITWLLACYNKQYNHRSQLQWTVSIYNQQLDAEASRVYIEMFYFCIMTFMVLFVDDIVKRKSCENNPDASSKKDTDEAMMFMIWLLYTGYLLSIPVRTAVTLVNTHGLFSSHHLPPLEPPEWITEKLEQLLQAARSLSAC
ncbi:hypothetical protein ACFORL_10095 [Legionella dresdenensis]|uniref:Uncharacterized protein n=1 Tax=Legionella dresdenensis TaxID=450200 RepID=A0ABV8CHC6_9GAMM